MSSMYELLITKLYNLNEPNCGTKSKREILVIALKDWIFQSTIRVLNLVTMIRLVLY